MPISEGGREATCWSTPEGQRSLPGDESAGGGG